MKYKLKNMTSVLPVVSIRMRNQSVTLGDEHKLRVCENSAEDKTLTQDIRWNCLIKT